MGKPWCGRKQKRSTDLRAKKEIGQHKDEQAAYVNLGVLKVCSFRPRQGEDRAYRRKTALQRFMLEHVPKLPNKLSEISDKINFIIDREIGRKGLPR
jgi:hypothetical protein